MTEKQKKEQALSISIKEGSASNISVSLGESYITPFLLALQASSFQIGILSALSGITNPLAQLYGGKLMKTSSRKEIVLKFAYLQTFLWAPLIIISLFALLNKTNIYFIISTILIYLSILICGGLIHPAWFSWMGDITEEKTRGRYLAKRSAIMSAVSLAAVVFGAYLLDVFKERSLLFLGFIFLFLLAAVSKLISYSFLRNIYEPKKVHRENYKVSFFNFFKEKTNTARFSRAMMIFSFSVMLASPFFGVYLLKELHLSYIWYTLVLMSGTGFYILFTPFAGKLADKYGSTNLLRLGSLLFVLTPIFWLKITNPLLLILFPQLVSGLANAFINVGSTNFSFESISANKRGTVISYVNLMSGIGILLGSFIGGFLIDFLPITTSTFMAIFLVSIVARGITAFFIMPQIKEEKRLKSSKVYLSLDIMHPLKTIQTDIHFIKHLAK